MVAQGGERVDGEHASAPAPGRAGPIRSPSRERRRRASSPRASHIQNGRLVQLSNGAVTVSLVPGVPAGTSMVDNSSLRR